MSVLVIAEHLRGELAEITLEVVSAAKELAGPVTVAIIAREPAPLSSALGLDGVSEIVYVKVDRDEFENDVYQMAVEALIADRAPEAVLLGFTVNSMGFAAAVAAKLALAFASDVFALGREGEAIVATHSFYSSKLHAEIEFPSGTPVILLLRPGAWPPAEQGEPPPITELELSAPQSRARHVAFREVPSDEGSITSADFLLAIGRGIGQRDRIELFAQLATGLGATLAASGPLIDAGWMPSSSLVGESGKTVQPKVYLAFGISGAPQHLAGMRTSKTIIAVNSDPRAAIFGVAHFGVVADLFDIAEHLSELV